VLNHSLLEDIRGIFKINPRFVLNLIQNFNRKSNTECFSKSEFVWHQA